MRKTITSLLANILCVAMLAQSKDFEGVAVYKVDITSKTEGVKDKIWKTMLALGDSVVVFIKQGNYKRSSGMSDEYQISKDEKAYLKFKGIDTLFYVDYSSDTTGLVNVLKTGEQKNIMGFECKSINITTPSSTTKYFFSPSLHLNPEYDKNNKIGRYDVYTKETESVWLAQYEENKSYALSQTCTRLEQKSIDETIFELPKLPQKKFSPESVSKPPEFTRSGGWLKFLQVNLNAELGAKYIKIPKREETASQTIMVIFLINEFGKVLNAEVINKKEVHSKLAEEALRVVNSFPLWKPATIYGEKTIFWYKMPITFAVSKK